jgi:tyrosyl-tRNA synthetase
VHLPELIATVFGGSRSEARRHLASGAVKLDGEPLGAGGFDLPAAELDGRVLQVGKRRFRRIRVA